jgi:hypothetical protein
VTELVFILTNFSAPEPDRPSAQQVRLPLLETLLSRSNDLRLDTDWRGWLAAACGSPLELAAFSLAAIVGAAFRGTAMPSPESTGYWLATPVHLFAGLDSVHLHPSGLLSLTAEEQQLLVSDFARVFADSPWRLERIARRELLLVGPQVQASAPDPATLLGDDPSAGLPRGADAGTLRRLGSEIEMWLYEHAVNRLRESRRELPVTGLWLWGAQPPTLPERVTRLPGAQLYGEDAYAESLWRLQGRQGLPLSSASTAIQTVPMSLSSDSVLLLTDGLQELEQHWLPGALRAMRQRRLSVLRLIAGRRSFEVSVIQLMRFWRARRPWWEVLA